MRAVSARTTALSAAREATARSAATVASAESAGTAGAAAQGAARAVSVSQESHVLLAERAPTALEEGATGAATATLALGAAAR